MEGDKKLGTYEVDLYLFVPYSFGIDNETFGSEHFYHSLQNYIRIQSPTELGRKAPEEIVLRALEKHFERRGIDRGGQELAIQEIKLFGCHLDGVLKRLKEGLIKLKENGGTEIIVPDILHKIHLLQSRLAFFRKRYLEEFANTDYEDIKRSLGLVDEYLVSRIEYLLTPELTGRDCKELLSIQVTVVLEKFLEQTYQHKIKCDYMCITSLTSKSQNEYYYYRQGVLKKYLYEVLYLRNNRGKRQSFFNNIVAMLGAALAAFWATMMEVQRMSMLAPGARINYVPLLALAIFAYVFKDRIKELTRETIKRYLSEYIPDYKAGLSYSYLQEGGKLKKILLGKIREYFHYIKPAAVSRKVMVLRKFNSKRQYEPDKLETILHYKRQIKFGKELHKIEASSLTTVKDIWRLDISDFLKRLGDPKTVLTLYDPDEGHVQTQTDNNYHLNIIISLRRRGPGEKHSRAQSLSRHRLVINKKGLVRLENVKEFNY